MFELWSVGIDEATLKLLMWKIRKMAAIKFNDGTGMPTKSVPVMSRNISSSLIFIGENYLINRDVLK